MGHCLVMCLLLICFTPGGQSLPKPRNMENDEKDLQDDDNENQIPGSNFPSMLTFVPARSCHVQFTKDSGIFSPPVFYGKVDVNLWCNWTILAAPEKHIVIYIDGFTTDMDCDDNQDEIIFEGISSSVETTIVYACWNKPTHIYATQAHVVNVLLLWRTFSHTGSRRYFEGRYFIFDDPTAVPSPCNCTLKLNKSRTIATDSKEPSISPPLYSPVLPAWSSSKILHHIWGFSTATYHETHNTGTMGNDLLKDIATLEVHPSPSYSMMGEGEKENTDRWTIEDLQPSYVGQREHGASLFWIWKTTSAQALSETPTLSTAYTTRFLKASPSSTKSSLELPVNLHLVDQGIAQVVDLSETGVTSIPFTSTLPLELDFTISYDEAPETYLFNGLRGLDPDMQQEQVGDPLFHDVHPEKSHHITSQFMIPPAVVPLRIFQTKVPWVSFIKNGHETKLPETFHLGLAEMTKPSDAPIRPTRKIIVLPQSHSTVPSDVPYLENVQLVTPSNISQVSLDYFVKPTLSLESYSTIFRPKHHPEISLLHDPVEKDQHVFSNHHKTATLLTTMPLPGSSGSQLGDTVLAHTMIWHAATLPSQTAGAEIIQSKSLDDRQITETSTPHLAPQLFSAIHVSSPESTSASKSPAIFLPATSLSNGIGSSVVILPIPVHRHIHSEHSSAVEHTVSASSLHDDMLLLGPQMVPEVTNSSLYTPRPLVKSISSKSSQFEGMSGKMETKSQTSPTDGPKPIESFKKVTRLLDSESVTHTLYDTSYDNKTIAQPLTTSTMTYMSLFSQILKSISLPFNHENRELQGTHPPQTTNKPQASLNVTDGKNTQMTPTDNEENAIQKYTGHKNDHVDLDEKEDTGQSNDDHFDDDDVIKALINETDLGVTHYPGDTLFNIIVAINHRHQSLIGQENELAEALKIKIIEKMKSFPGGVNKLILMDAILTNTNRLTLTLWLHMKSGGKDIGNFIMTQVKTLEQEPIGLINATLVSISVEDVNECQLGVHNCDVKAHCENVVGTYSCQCMPQYEDHSAAVPGTLCIAPEPEETRSLKDHLGILIASITSVCGTLLLVVLILCIVHLRRRAKVNFSLQEKPSRRHGAHLPGALPVYPGEPGQAAPSLTRHLSPRHSKEPLTARDTSSTLELTNITFEQTAC